ncbi:ABC transporter substrate-binding protein, partial [Actinomadura logoneensis]
ACGGGDGGGSRGGGKAAALPAATGKDDLRGACPATVTLQMNWYPQAEHGGLYHLLGPSPKVDADHKTLTAPLTVDGHDTGVRFQIRSGGPVTGFQPVSSLMASDPSITLGVVATDEQVAQAGTHRLQAVFSPMDVNPQIIMWSPQAHPDWKTIADVGRGGATVLYANGASFMDYLTSSGQLRRSQLDGSYDGSPARFAASGGKIAQQGYVTNEPYSYEHEVTAWRKPVAFQLVHDTGYAIYPESVAIRPADKARLAPCLKRLVPIFQRATAEYMRDPAETNRMIVDAVRRFNTTAAYTAEHARFAHEALGRYGIVRNGADGVLGSFDTARVQKVIGLLRPLEARGGKPVPAGLSAGDLVTGEFLDRSVHL